MTKKEYVTPKMEEWPVHLEGPLCQSGWNVAAYSGLEDYELLNAGDIVWD